MSSAALRSMPWQAQENQRPTVIINPMGMKYRNGGESAVPVRYCDRQRQHTPPYIIHRRTSQRRPRVLCKLFGNNPAPEAVLDIAASKTGQGGERDTGH